MHPIPDWNLYTPNVDAIHINYSFLWRANSIQRKRVQLLQDYKYKEEKERKTIYESSWPGFVSQEGATSVYRFFPIRTILAGAITEELGR